MNYRMFLAAVALPLAALPTAVFAQDEDAATSGPFDISAQVGVFSDYRYRGISLSGKDPEVTASVTISHESGLYASVWSSNVDLGNGGAKNVEVDWTAGFSKDFGPISFDAGAVYYTYANHSGFNYFEAYGSLGTTVGPADIKVGVAYAPSQNNIGGQDNTYVYVAGDLPFGESGWSAHGSLGLEDGAFGDNKKDWKIGMSYDLGSGLTATVDYIDSARSFSTLGDATVVGGLTFDF